MFLFRTLCCLASCSLVHAFTFSGRRLVPSPMMLQPELNPGQGGGTLLHTFQSTFSRSTLAASYTANDSDDTLTTLVAEKSSDDARGAALLMHEVTIFLGGGTDSLIVQNANWRIEPNTKWALVGSNGSGKSTLLKAIVGEISYEGNIYIGQAKRGSGKDVAYLRQTAVAGSTKTVFEEAASGMTAIVQARMSMEQAELNQNWDALNEALLRFDAAGGYQQEQRVSGILRGLGFSLTDFEKPCQELSGGWQMRVALARTLLAEPILSILDEPGNHLDAAAKKWLAQYLRNYSGGSLILVTHDVELLESMKNIAEITSRSLQLYKSCDYQEFLQVKQFRAESAIMELERNKKKAAKLQAFVDRFGASAARASAAQSRVKQIDRLKEQGLLDAPAQAIVATRFRPRLVLPDPPVAIGEVLLSLKDNAQVGYDGKPLVSLNVDIVQGMKLLIRGPNGAGKSTVLHSLRGKLPLISGTRVENQSLRLGVFTQDLAQELDVTARAVDLVTAYARQGPYGNIMVSDQDARDVLGGLGLRGEKSLRRVGDLSGGEKARVALAMFSLKACNLYLLDEASNHLDAECVETLSEALSHWGEKKGAIVVVSHDQNFCEKIGFTHVGVVRNGKFILEQRDSVPSDFLVDSMFSPLTTVADEQAASIDHDATDAADLTEKSIDPALRKKAYNAPKRIAKLEELIATAEKKKTAIDEEMLRIGSNVEKVMFLNKQREDLDSQVMRYMEEWEELEELMNICR